MVNSGDYRAARAGADNITLSFSRSDDKKATIKSVRQKEEIIAYLTNHVSARSVDIAELFGVKSTRAKQLLKELQDEGVVIAEGGNKNRVYKVKR